MPLTSVQPLSKNRRDHYVLLINPMLGSINGAPLGLSWVYGASFTQAAMVFAENGNSALPISDHTAQNGNRWWERLSDLACRFCRKISVVVNLAIIDGIFPQLMASGNLFALWNGNFIISIRNAQSSIADQDKE